MIRSGWVKIIWHMLEKWLKIIPIPCITGHGVLTLATLEPCQTGLVPF